MDDELALAFNILRTRVNENKMAVIYALVQSEQQGSNLAKQKVKLIDARWWLDMETNTVNEKIEAEEGS